MTLTWEEKLQAFHAIDPYTTPQMRFPGNWYVGGHLDVKRGAFLVGEYGEGATPQAAIEDHWRVLVDELPPDDYLVRDAMKDSRKGYRWNGVTWAPVEWDSGAPAANAGASPED